MIDKLNDLLTKHVDIILTSHTNVLYISLNNGPVLSNTSLKSTSLSFFLQHTRNNPVKFNDSLNSFIVYPHKMDNGQNIRQQFFKDISSKFYHNSSFLEESQPYTMKFLIKHTLYTFTSDSRNQTDLQEFPGNFQDIL